MNKPKRYYYIIKLQFLGFRFNGWQKQKGVLGVKTLQAYVEKTLKFVFEHTNFKILGAGRTDAKVSANNFPIELFIYEQITDFNQFLAKFNTNLPNDIKVLSITETNADFNIIRNSKVKEYLYFFSYGHKAHPFAAPMITFFYEDLDIEIMKKGAKLFQGKHNFKHYCTQPTEKAIFNREITCSEIIENTIYTANFFPKKSYVYRIKSSGFLRNQIRLMMGTLFRLGKGEIDINFIEKSLLENQEYRPLPFIAPASGLILNNVEFTKKVSN